MTTVIEVAGLTKRYRDQAVVDGICFQVEQGEIFGILGPNGAGKTTAVECLEGPRRRDSGQVTILGLDPRTVRADGVTVVLVSHFMDEVEELCDRVAILERGRIVALDTPAGLVDSAGAQYRMRFRPMAPLDEQSLAALPGVRSVTAELARSQVILADLRISGRSLDSAYVALTGQSMDT